MTSHAARVLAAEEAARRFEPGWAPVLRSLLDEMRTGPPADRYLELNQRFHAGVYARSEMLKLVDLISAHRDASSAYLRIYRAEVDFPAERLDAEHRAILDAIVARDPEVPRSDGDPRHAILLANCLAQGAALAIGKPLPAESSREGWHKAFPGNRPSTTIVLPRIGPGSLGALLAAYEHATFVASVVLGINAFDQFGVEYGKVMATSIEAVLDGHDDSSIDSSTRALIGRIRNNGSH